MTRFVLCYIYSERGFDIKLHTYQCTEKSICYEIIYGNTKLSYKFSVAHTLIYYIWYCLLGEHDYFTDFYGKIFMREEQN